MLLFFFIVIKEDLTAWFGGKLLSFAALKELYNPYPNHIIIKLDGKSLLPLCFEFHYFYFNFYINPSGHNATAIVNDKVIAAVEFNETIPDKIRYFSFASGTDNQVQQYFFNCQKNLNINSGDIE